MTRLSDIFKGDKRTSIAKPKQRNKYLDKNPKPAKIPRNNQSINLSMKGFEITKASNRKGEDLLLGLAESMCCPYSDQCYRKTDLFTREYA